MLDQTFSNQLTVDANLRIDVIHLPTGLSCQKRVKNKVVLSGRNLMRDLLTGDSTADVSHIAVGTSGTVVADSDTALGGEVTRLAFTKHATSDNQAVFYLYLPSTAANGSTLQEAGIFNAASAGDMFARATHTSIAKTASIAIYYTWTINLGAS